MTDKLKQLLHERTDAVDFAMPDVDALTRAGDRRLRTRRWGTVGACAAAAVAVAVLAPNLIGDQRAADPASGGGRDGYPVTSGDLPRDMFAQGRVIWSWDSVIHYGDITVDVGRPIDAFVRTEIGFVFASDGEVWEVDGDMQQRIGQVDAKHPRLVSDEETPDAGWVDPTGDTPAFVVFDHGTGDTTRYDEATTPDMGSLADEKNPAYFYAIDGHTAYWHDERGAVATDLETGDVQVIDADARNGFAIVDVEDDLIAFSEEQGTRVSQSADDAGTMLEGAYGSMADFSPNARYYAADADEAQVFDDSTGEQVRLDLAGYGFSTAFGWIGNDTVVVLASKSEQASMELLTCTVPGGVCTPYVDDLGTTEEIVGHFQIPVGETIGGD